MSSPAPKSQNAPRPVSRMQTRRRVRWRPFWPTLSAPPKFTVDVRLYATASSWSQSGQLGIAGCDYSAHAKATFPSARLVRCHLGVARLRQRPTVRRTRPANGSRGVETIPADRDLIAEFQPGFSQIVLRFDQDYLCKTLSRLIDSPVVDLQFAPGVLR